MNHHRTFGLVFLALHFLAAPPSEALAIPFQLGPFTATDGTVISGTLDIASTTPSGYESLSWTVTNPDGSYGSGWSIDNSPGEPGNNSVGGNLQLVAGPNGTYQLVGTSLGAQQDFVSVIWPYVAPPTNWFTLGPNPNGPGMEINIELGMWNQAAIGNPGTTWYFPTLQAPFVVATGSQPLPEPSAIALASIAVVLASVNRMKKSRLGSCRRLKLWRRTRLIEHP